MQHDYEFGHDLLRVDEDRVALLCDLLEIASGSCASGANGGGNSLEIDGLSGRA
jgi:hypothetical protein